MNFLPYRIKKIFKKQFSVHTFNKLMKSLECSTPINYKTDKDNPENIVFDNTIAGKGGAAKIAYDGLYKNLKVQGYKTDIYVNKNYESFLDGHIHLMDNLAPKEQKLLLNEQYKNGWLDFFYLQSLKLTKQKTFIGVDIIHLHNLHGGYFSPFAIPEISRLKPTIWTLHDEQALTGHCACFFDCEKWQDGCKNCPDINNYPGVAKDTSSFLYETKKKIYQKSNITIVVPSNWLKTKVEKSILKHFDLRLIYNGVNEQIFKNHNKSLMRLELNLPPDKKILMFSALMGMDDPLKGTDFIKMTYESLKEHDDIFFLTLGGVESKKIADNFIQIGYILDESMLAKYYAASDLFIYPSLTDNCPLSVLESLSCGTPVISFKTGGIPELIKHMDTGYLSEYKDIDDFVKGTKVYLNNEELLQSASIKARTFIKNDFTLDIMISKYIELYREVYAKAKSL